MFSSIYLKFIVVLTSLTIDKINGRLLNKTILFETFGYSIESTHIDLNGQSIDEIDLFTFDGLNHLEILNLEDNKITKIEKNLFNGLTQLKLLSLESNKIIEIEKSVFNGLDSLELVCLNDNPVANMFPALLTSLCDTNSKCILKISQKCNQTLTASNPILSQILDKLNKFDEFNDFVKIQLENLNTEIIKIQSKYYFYSLTT